MAHRVHGGMQLAQEKEHNRMNQDLHQTWINQGFAVYDTPDDEDQDAATAYRDYCGAQGIAYIALTRAPAHLHIDATATQQDHLSDAALQGLRDLYATGSVSDDGGRTAEVTDVSPDELLRAMQRVVRIVTDDTAPFVEEV